MITGICIANDIAQEYRGVEVVVAVMCNDGGQNGIYMRKMQCSALLSVCVLPP